MQPVQLTVKYKPLSEHKIFFFFLKIFFKNLIWYEKKIRYLFLSRTRSARILLKKFLVIVHCCFFHSASFTFSSSLCCNARMCFSAQEGAPVAKGHIDGLINKKQASCSPSLHPSRDKHATEAQTQSSWFLTIRTIQRITTAGHRHKVILRF